MEATAEAGAYEEMLRVVEACAARIRWRLRPDSKRRLLNGRYPVSLHRVAACDTDGLCSTMPQLQENICSLLHHARQEASILNPLRVMVIKDMMYLIHVKGLAEHASPNARSQHQLAFVDLEKSCCELLSNTADNGTVLELLSIQDLFSAKFPVEAAVDLPANQPGRTKQKSELPVPESTTDVECTAICIADMTSLFVDLSAFLESAQIVLPFLNGSPRSDAKQSEEELLSCPMLMRPPDNCIRCRIDRNTSMAVRSHPPVLLWYPLEQVQHLAGGFPVPCDMSAKRGEEPWAKSFLAHMNEKLERCNHVWASMRLEIEVFQSQSRVIVL